MIAGVIEFKTFRKKKIHVQRCRLYIIYRFVSARFVSARNAAFAVQTLVNDVSQQLLLLLGYHWTA